MDCRLIVDLTQVVLTRKVGDDKSPLALQRPTTPLTDKDILCHHHHILTRNLPGLEPDLQRVQGYLIATHIGEVAVEMWRDREAKARARKVDGEKGFPELLDTNLP